jgi:hypothetical protein
MTTHRVDPPRVADEKTMLVAWLEYHRATLELKCAGLPPDRLAERSVPPSTLSLLGLVRHMTEVERSWFRRRLAGEDAPHLYYTDADPDGDFDNLDSVSVEEAFAAWRSECDHARRLVAAHSLDDLARRPRDRPLSLRWIMIHMIEEYARHNGHADLLRERIDGAVGD